MKNAAISVNVKDWGVEKGQGGWIELEITGSFEDDEGQVVITEPERRTVSFPVKEKKSRGISSPRMLDPRQRGPI